MPDQDKLSHLHSLEIAAIPAFIKAEESLNCSTEAETVVAPFMDETFVVLTHP